MGKVQGLIRSINNNLNNYNKRYIKTKFIPDNDLPLKKTLNLENIELHKIIIVLDLFSMRVINTLQKSQMNVCINQLSKAQMSEYHIIDISEDIDTNRDDDPRECIICHYQHFFGKSFRFLPNVCDSCHDMTQTFMSFNNVAIATVERNDNRIHDDDELFLWYG